MVDNQPDQLTGRALKVLSVDAENRSVYARGPDGLVTRFYVLHGALPREASVILLGPERWEYAPDDILVLTPAVATVRALLDEGRVLLDDGLTIKIVQNVQDLELGVRNAVEFNEVEGIIRVLSDTPIRSRDDSVENEDILNEYLVDTSGDGPTFGDFGGYPEVIARARELIETQLERRELLEAIGARPVKGILFTGPPGTGKTHLARIIAHESKADFFLVSGPSIVSKWVGDTEDTLRKIFDAAAVSSSGRAIVFFDEIDSIAERRSGESHEASKRLVAQLLTLMDGFSTKGGSVVVIAATNRVESLDPALTRPGRFDWEIEFGAPSLADRLAILRVQAAQLKTASWLPLEDVAVLTSGWSGADLNALWVEGALLAAGDTRASIEAEDLALAYERVSDRPRRSSASEPVA